MLLTALAATGTAAAGDPALYVLVDGSIEMPQARVEDGRVVDGLQYQIAMELGQRLGRTVRFRLVPRRRMAQLLGEGHEADLSCNYLPGWLPGPLQWSRPYLDDADLLVTAARRPAPAQLQELAGQRIGTVTGFLYPEAEAVLGAGFLRDDAPNLVTNLRKLASGRMDHALVGRVSFDYLQRRGEVPLELHPPLVVAKLRPACALSPHSSLSLAQLDAAIAAMLADGSLARIVEHLR
ncbi:substrate-binding periplasmic protein [Roseateles saccharophilus]|uniref:Amino acid ABC transporter substrate-binding protein (PAAT family) n=1 Tax=Roseateles saccharophilus TaxID=304 RepID=A0A4R3UJI2_ROSSA|nr:transporter substrate-binding domain-containing protein [Roseateles saccharophilus]TCU89940.1 amino acid ABC transporter substrate-binding protein (PAAT family) [Roseateles saccharophilus]